MSENDASKDASRWRAVARLVVARVLSALATLIVVSVLVFAAMQFIPGSYEDLILGPFQNDAARDRLVDRYALDQPPWRQYLSWLSNLVQGDFGTSLATRDAIGPELRRRIVPTLQLTVMATLLAVSIGVPLGIWSGLSDHKPWARGLSRIVGAAGLSVPDFVFGTALVYAFSRWSLGLRVGGYEPLLESPVDNLLAMALPAGALAMFGIALVMRTTRTATLDTLAEPFIVAAVARGESPRSIVRHHVLRNSAIPVVTVVATYFGVLLGGAVIIEDLFSVPGLGRYVVTAIAKRDYAVMQATVLVAAAVFVVVNMVADILYTILDPRLAVRRR